MNSLAGGTVPRAYRPRQPRYPSEVGAASKLRTLSARRKNAESRRSMALVLTLATLVLMTLLVVVFLSTVTLDRRATASYDRALQADSIALGGLDQVVSQIETEITTNTCSTFVGSMYEPITNTNAVPQRMSTAVPVPIVTYSGLPVYPGGASLASSSLTTTAAANNRFVSMNRWYQPQLTLTTNGFPVPQWILVARNGTFPTTSTAISTLANHTLTNGSYVVGRYAYVVYDTSGLIDANVAGYPISTGTNAANKGALPWIDLTQLSGNISSSDVDAMIAWRNASNYTNYVSYETNWATNGFMQIAPGDNAFLSRQELINYAQTQNPDLTNALPYLTTFSRELNGPTWGPETNMGSVDGINFNYLTEMTNLAVYPGTYNPLIYNPTVQTVFTRDNGVSAVVGEPLVKYRFPLDKLALLEKMRGAGTLSATDMQQIQQYFGLDLASDVTPSSGYYRHWNYPTTNTAYPHGLGASGSTGIMSLYDVATYGNREPDFFELLQAGILQGSLGVYSGYQTTAVLKAHARSDILGGTGTATYLNGLSISDTDTSKTYQILRIGANIIDQWHADNYPTAITYLPSGQSVYGICDLPYICGLFLNFYSASMTAGSATSPSVYICPQLWNPHQPSGATNTPTQFQIAPDPGDEWNIQYFAPGSISAPVGAIFKFDANTGTFPYPSPTNAVSVDSAPFGVTNNIVFTAGSSDYRDPSMITNATSGNAAGPWNPTGPTVGAIQLTNIPLPASTDLDNSNPSGTGYFSAASVAAAQPPYSAYNPTANPTQLTWAQATNTANYASFGITTGPPIYEFDWGMNGVFVLEFYNPSNNTYYPYATFEGFADSAGLSTGYSFGGTGEKIQTAAASVLAHVDAWFKSDPRTFRFGPVRRSPNAPGAGPTVAPYLSSFPTTAMATNLINQAAPFVSGASPTYPYRFDMWTVNDPGIVPQGQAASIPTTNVASYTDPDGAYRYGDSHYSYNSTAGYETPFLTGQTSYRPVVLHRPFRSVGELGYVFRDDPWRTLDFFSPGSADAGLLDLFTLSHGQTVLEHNGQLTVATAGKINPNTPYPQVLEAMMAGATRNIAGGTTLSSNTAFNVASSLVTLSTAAPFVNRADLATRFMTNTAFSTVGLYLKSDRETIIRSLAESSNTRTWNFMVDIVAQSGTYPTTATSNDNFVVGGERHYWLHIAIDRYTGQVIDKQLEVVNQ